MGIAHVHLIDGSSMYLLLTSSADVVRLRCMYFLDNEVFALINGLTPSFW